MAPSNSTYHEILASLRGLAKVPGARSDPLVMALLEPARIELFGLAESLRHGASVSAERFYADLDVLTRCGKKRPSRKAAG